MSKPRTYNGAANAGWWVEDRGGTPWHEAAAPPRRHKHWAQTQGGSGLEITQRCPCGAFRQIGNHASGEWFHLDKPRVAPRRTLRSIFKRK